MAPANADVIVKHKSTTDMAGLMNIQIDGADNYKSDKRYVEITSEMTGGMMAMMGGGKPRQMVNITRLDKGVVWELDPQAKKYREMTLASLKGDAQETKGEADKESEKSDYTWTVDVKTIDQPQNINGFECKGIIGIATGVKNDQPSDTMFITIEQWSAQNVPGAAEVDQYQKNYAKAVGVDEMWADKNMNQMMKEYGNQFTALTEKMSQNGGYPIKTIMSMESSASKSKGDSEGQNMSSQDIMGKMGGLFGKKKSGGASGSDEVSKGGRAKTFMMTNEVISIEQKPVDESKFEIPADFKKD